MSPEQNQPANLHDINLDSSSTQDSVQAASSMPNNVNNDATSNQPDPKSDKELRIYYAGETKKIMRQNANDPYTLVEMMKKLRQKYWKEVYHKDVKLPREQ